MSWMVDSANGNSNKLEFALTNDSQFVDFSGIDEQKKNNFNKELSYIHFQTFH